MRHLSSAKFQFTPMHENACEGEKGEVKEREKEKKKDDMFFTTELAQISHF